MKVIQLNDALQEHDCLSQQTRAPLPDVTALVVHYQDPAVILGCSQRPDDGMRQRADENGLMLLRRRAGGGAVLADKALLSISLLFPPAHRLAQLDSIDGYSVFGEAWVHSLHNLGITCRLPTVEEIDASKSHAKARSIDWACYGALGHGEVISDDGRKLVGIAQIRTRHCVAMVAGLQLSPVDWSVLCRVFGMPTTQAVSLEAVNTDALSLGVELGDEAIEPLLEQLSIACDG